MGREAALDILPQLLCEFGRWQVARRKYDEGFDQFRPLGIWFADDG